MRRGEPGRVWGLRVIWVSVPVPAPSLTATAEPVRAERAGLPPARKPLALPAASRSAESIQPERSQEWECPGA